MHYIYLPEIDFNSDPSFLVGKPINVTGDEAHHISKVLRSRIGTEVKVINGKGLLAKGTISAIEKRSCTVHIEEVKFVSQENPRLTIAIAPTKSLDRLEWFLEKATEIGVQRIVPILSSNAERKVVKQERMTRVLIAALKQSQQTWLPQLDELTPFKQLVKTAEGERYIAHCEEDEKTTLVQALKKGQDASILIGPEGDFSPDEINEALAAGWKPVSLGKNRLRTETAGLAAVQIFQSVQQL